MNGKALGKKQFTLDQGKEFLVNNSIIIVMLLVIVGICVMEPSFLTMRNFTYILQQTAPRLIIACAIASIAMMGGRDLAAGRCIGVAGITCAVLLQDNDYIYKIYSGIKDFPIIPAILVAAVFCIFFTCLQSQIIYQLKLNPFIASLALEMVIYGILSLYFEKVNNTSPVAGLAERYTNIAQGSFYLGSVRIPYIVLIAIGVVLLYSFLWNRTALGRSMFAIGGNKAAAEISGVNIRKTYLWIYAIAGLTYALAGFLEGGRTGSAVNTMGANYAMDAIAATVVGGVSLSGGIGTIRGVVVGVFVFQLINYGLVYVGISTYWQEIVKGCIIIFAVALDMRKNAKKR